MSLERTGSLNINISVKGQGAAPFIWAHGLMGSIQLDDDTGYFHAQCMTDKIKLIRYDARGHGQSSGTDDSRDYLWSNLAKDMIAVADKSGIEHFIAGGQSMGSMTALNAAIMFPERIKALVLATPSTIWETRAVQASLYHASAGIIEEKGLNRFIEMMRNRPLLPPWLLAAKPSDHEKYMKNILKMNGKILPHILRGSALSDLPHKGKFRPPKVPTLILAWKDDPIHPLQSADILHDLLPDSELIIAGNPPDQEKWPEIICEFIARKSISPAD